MFRNQQTIGVARGGQANQGMGAQPKKNPIPIPITPPGWKHGIPGVGGLPGQNPYQQQPQQPQPQALQSMQQPAPFRGLQVDTSVQPQGVFPADFTRQAGNLAAAMNVPAVPDLLARNMREGISVQSPMTQYAAGADAAQGLAAAAMAPQQVGMEHGFANAISNLRGQIARDREGLGLAQVGLEDYLGRGNTALSQQGSLLGFLAALLGGYA